MRTVYCDGMRVLCSDKNGVFALDSYDNTAEKLSDQTADQISACNDKIVFKSGRSLCLLSDTLVEIYNGDFKSFAVSSDGKHLIVVLYDGGYDMLDILLYNSHIKHRHFDITQKRTAEVVLFCLI